VFDHTHTPETTAPQITRPSLPAAEHLLPRDAGGYGIYPILEVSLGEFVGRVWRHVSRDADASWTEYDCTIDGLSTAGSAGIEDPQQLRDLASVAGVLADELAALRAPIDAAMDRHPAGNGRVVGK
jgi:hypothetical protein